MVITTRWRKESVTAWRRLEEASERMRQEFWFRKVFPTRKQEGRGDEPTPTENKVKNWRARQTLVQSWRWLDRDSETLFSRVILEIVCRTRLWDKVKKKKRAKKVVRCWLEPQQLWCTRAAGELARAWIIKHKNMAQTSANLIAKKVSRFYSTFQTFPVALNHIHYSFLAPSLCEHYTVWILTLVCVSAQV